MRSLLLKSSAALVYGTLCQGAPVYNVLTENFNNVSAMSDWVMLNLSAPAGSTSWFQGNSGIFPAQSGAAGSYIAANFLSAGAGGDISNWLISPLLTFNNGDLISFYSRTESVPAIAADRLELRFNATGSTNAGASPASVGDFTGLMLTINPTLTITGYPAAWTQYSALVSGLPGPTNARFALRYFVTNTNVNGNYTGVDTLSVLSEVPEPGTIWTACLASFLLAARKTWRSRMVASWKTASVIGIAVIFAVSAFGADPRHRKGKRAAGKTQQAAGSAGMRVYIDPQTGEMREAPPQTNAERRSPQSRPSNTVVTDNADGSKMAILGDDHMVDSVAKLNSDGSVSISHAKPAGGKKAEPTARKETKR